MQISLMHDVLYTKAEVTYVFCIRVISSLGTVTALSLFHIQASYSKDGYNRVDAAVTYVLLIGAVVLEITIGIEGHALELDSCAPGSEGRGEKCVASSRRHSWFPPPARPCSSRLVEVLVGLHGPALLAPVVRSELGQQEQQDSKMDGTGGSMEHSH
jgi:hypothetical protein